MPSFDAHLAAIFGSLTSSFLVALPALLSIVNPIGGALIYHRVASGYTPAERVALAWRVAMYSAIVMLGSLWIGASLMSFFGVSIEALRIAGGAVVAASAWKMLYSPQENEDRKQAHADEAAFSRASDVAFFPMTMPLTTGPGTISVAIALSASRPVTTGAIIPFFIGVSSAAIAVALTVGVCYASADRVVSILGNSRARVLTRLSAFLLLCIGVQILMTGMQGGLAAAIQSAR